MKNLTAQHNQHTPEQRPRLGCHTYRTLAEAQAAAMAGSLSWSHAAAVPAAIRQACRIDRTEVRPGEVRYVVRWPRHPAEIPLMERLRPIGEPQPLR